MKSGIYMIMNLSNNKIYVGSSKDMSRRKREHFRALLINKHRNKYLQSSYNKHTKEMFVFIILEYCSTEQLITRENYWIDLKKSNDNKKGYNLSVPKENGGFEMTELTREKLKRIANEKHYGKLTDEQYQELLNKKIEYKNRERIHKTKKKILGFNKDTGELIKKFNSISELGTSSNIHKVINNQQYSYKGMVLIEEKMYDCNIVYKQIKKEIIKKPNYIKIGRFKGDSVETFDLETNEIIKKYTTTLELAKDFNITKRYVYRVLCGERKSFKNMGIRYSE
ncbi:homing endonuclease [Flavobacterium phage Fpv1]|uniref:GIY-YIG domain-containing protein n=2 Tax=Fipvunavirus Fpv1 TaxID=2560475 RepID=A0A1B0WKP6_9CAUD|nr:homing endonuclease [Flavobacterium phage Fpv20]YP_009322003.1 homing endonuclease [Flavobacterium phage Fpv1]YP_009323592.1 homing endonuclease [Flavobacterium phage Fpv2]ALN97247.1 hypothetical protein [Flavobacterium phage FpV21]QCW20255.1 hypothetical protein [Flavobacterium phage FPSV-F12]QCW20658.1 hypothetical protein [Flavobacterium phage FPSV-S29]ANB40243.1 hypothetical protein [Flavobacterium phage Fpv1]ANB40323.1 hypothetical protein [Flavobacterium phage Fpv2]